MREESGFVRQNFCPICHDSWGRKRVDELHKRTGQTVRQSEQVVPMRVNDSTLAPRPTEH